MSVLYLFLILALIGLVAWVLTEFIPMPQKMQQLIIVVAVVVALVYVLAAFGVLHSHIAVPTIK